MSTPVIVFAKAPVPGEVKTRLVATLGAAGAAALHRRMVRRAVATALEAAVGPAELCAAPDRSHPFFAACAREFGVALTEQGPGDLGDRMARALARRAPALLIGADCPVLAAQHLRAAARALTDGYDAVLGPAEDGGYVLVGLAHAANGMFERIQWGSACVLAATRERLRTLGLDWFELPVLWDVDRPEDLARMQRELGGGGRVPDAV